MENGTDKVTRMFDYLLAGKKLHMERKFYEASCYYEEGLKLGLQIYDQLPSGRDKEELSERLSFFSRCLEKSKGHNLDDVIGLEDFKKLFFENIFSVVRNKELAKEYGVFANCCVLLQGPPGTGKSYAIKAAINEFPEAELFEEKTSNLVDAYIGNTGKNIDALFEKAKTYIKGKEDRYAIIFIDEIDGIARSRTSDDKGAKEAMSALLVNLTKIDEENLNIIFIGATNTPDQLDAAFLSRFGNNIIEIPLPNDEGRVNILKKNLKQLDGSIDWDKVAEETKGLNGRDLKFIANDSNKEAFNQARLGVKGPVSEEILIEVIRTAKKRRSNKKSYL